MLVPPACEEVLRQLGDYLDGALDATAEAKFREHLQRCYPCRTLRDTVRKTLQLYRSMPACPVPPEVASRLMQALERQAGSKH